MTIDISIEDLKLYHKSHLRGEVPEIKFDAEVVTSMQSDDASEEASFRVGDLVNDYYNLQTDSSVPLTRHQQEYLQFRAKHMAEFIAKYKPEQLVHEKHEEYEELDY